MTRRERVQEVARLRATGMTQREIGAHLGLGRSYVAALLSDPEGNKVRARKDRYRGRCEVCGTPTDGSNGRSSAPTHCKHHAPATEEGRALRTVWSRDAILTAIREWADEHHGEPPASPDWNPTHARTILHDEERARQFEEDPRWPWFTTVCQRFGSWNAAIEAAGFTPRAPHGGDGNQYRKRAAA